MSASEKLQALDLGPGTIDDAELGMMGYDGLLVLRDALPQIVAVVEAAEEWDRRARDYESNWEETRAALADLNLALQSLERRRLLVLRSAQAALVAQIFRAEEVIMVAGDPELDELLQELTNVSLRIGAFAERSGWLDAIDDFEEMLDNGGER